MNILFFRDPDVWSLLRPAAEMVRAAGHQVRVVPRRVMHGPGAGGLADVAGDALAAAEIIVAAPRAPVTAAMMDQAPRLRALVSPVGGVDSFDLPEAARRAIIVAHGGEVASRGQREAEVVALGQLVNPPHELSVSAVGDDDRPPLELVGVLEGIPAVPKVLTAERDDIRRMQEFVHE